MASLKCPSLPYPKIQELQNTVWNLRKFLVRVEVTNSHHSNSQLQIGISPNKQRALKRPGHLLNTNSTQRDPGAQGTQQTTYRNVSPSLSFRTVWLATGQQRIKSKCSELMCKAHSFLLTFTLSLILNTPCKT